MSFLGRKERLRFALCTSTAGRKEEYKQEKKKDERGKGEKRLKARKVKKGLKQLQSQMNFSIRLMNESNETKVMIQHERVVPFFPHFSFFFLSFSPSFMSRSNHNRMGGNEKTKCQRGKSEEWN